MSILLVAQVAFGVPSPKTTLKDVLCVITGSALSMCSSASTSEEKASSLEQQGADQRECRHNLEAFGLRIGQDCPKKALPKVK